MSIFIWFSWVLFGVFVVVIDFVIFFYLQDLFCLVLVNGLESGSFLLVCSGCSVGIDVVVSNYVII